MNTMMVASHAGGQGKTTFAQLLYLAAKKAGQNYKMVAADFVDDSGRSKLGKLYPDRVEEFGAGAALTASRSLNNMNAPLRYWDKIGAPLLQGGYIIDAGANVISDLVEWGVDRHAAKLMEKRGAPKLDVFCMTKAEKHSTDDTAKLIGSLLSRNPFRISRIFIVQNEAGGSFERMGLQAAIARAFPGENFEYLTVPRCHSEIWDAMERAGVSMERALDLDEDEAVQLLDVDLWTAASGLVELRSWFDSCSAMLREVEVVQRVAA